MVGPGFLLHRVRTVPQGEAKCLWQFETDGLGISCAATGHRSCKSQVGFLTSISR